MRVLKITTDEHRSTAAELPRGRVFASGKAFVPFVGKMLYQRLLSLSGSAEGADRGKNPLNRTDPKNGSEMALMPPFRPPKTGLGSIAGQNRPLGAVSNGPTPSLGWPPSAFQHNLGLV
jgi:hypothetical protein